MAQLATELVVNGDESKAVILRECLYLLRYCI
jgi:hypothetical protein